MVCQFQVSAMPFFNLFFFHSSAHSRGVQQTNADQKVSSGSIRNIRFKVQVSSGLDSSEVGCHSPTMTHLLGWQGLQNSELKKPRGPEILQLLHKLGPQLQQSCQIGDFWRAFVNVPWTSLQVRQDRGGCHSMLVEFLVV